MALFNKKNGAKPGKDLDQGPEANRIEPLEAYCRICDDRRVFTKCWLRVRAPAKCMACGLPLGDHPEIYKKQQPACPKCGEYVEFPGFRYGICDGCKSKFELVEGTKPSLLPNSKQRAAMDKVGKTRDVT